MIERTTTVTTAVAETYAGELGVVHLNLEHPHVELTATEARQLAAELIAEADIAEAPFDWSIANAAQAVDELTIRLDAAKSTTEGAY